MKVRNAWKRLLDYMRPQLIEQLVLQERWEVKALL